MSIVISILLFVMGLDPSTGTITSNGKNIKNDINKSKLESQFEQLKQDYSALSKLENTNTSNTNTDTVKPHKKQDYYYFMNNNK